MDELDHLLRRRAHILVVAGFSFALWQGMTIATNLVPEGTAMFGLAAGGLIVGAVLWALTMVAVIIFGRKVGAAKAAIDDELTRHNRYKAFAYGWVYTLAVISLGYGAETLWPGTAPVSLHMGLITAVSVPMVAFARLELHDLKGA